MEELKAQNEEIVALQQELYVLRRERTKMYELFETEFVESDADERTLKDRNERIARAREADATTTSAPKEAATSSDESGDAQTRGTTPVSSTSTRATNVTTLATTKAPNTTNSTEPTTTKAPNTANSTEPATTTTPNTTNMTASATTATASAGSYRLGGSGDGRSRVLDKFEKAREIVQNRKKQKQKKA